MPASRPQKERKMPTPLEFLQRYRRLRVSVISEDTAQRTCREVTRTVSLRTYFMMNWTDGTEQLTDFNHVVGGGRRNTFYRDHQQQILNAAMGKGSPRDYELALEWAVLSGKTRSSAQADIQQFCDSRLGIDCSGFVTNFLVANGRKPNTPSTVRNTSAASYFSRAKAVNDPNEIRQGDLLVWMDGNSVRRSPGHVAVVESSVAECVAGGNLRVVEATGAAGANPKLLDSMYTVEAIEDATARRPVLVLVVRRHGRSGSRVSIMRH